MVERQSQKPLARNEKLFESDNPIIMKGIHCDVIWPLFIVILVNGLTFLFTKNVKGKIC